jgi:hypothetical protein
MSHEADESLGAIQERNPGNPDVTYLVEQYRNLRQAYDTLQEGTAHLLGQGLIRREDMDQVSDPPPAT